MMHNIRSGAEILIFLTFDLEHLGQGHMVKNVTYAIR